jgi:hypothetical protein
VAAVIRSKSDGLAERPEQIEADATEREAEMTVRVEQFREQLAALDGADIAVRLQTMNSAIESLQEAVTQRIDEEIGSGPNPINGPGTGNGRGPRIAGR